MLLDQLSAYENEPRSDAGAVMVKKNLALFKEFLGGSQDVSPQTLTGFNDWLQGKHSSWGPQTRRMALGHVKAFFGWLRRREDAGVNLPATFDNPNLPPRKRKKKEPVMSQQPPTVVQANGVDDQDELLDRGGFADDVVPAVAAVPSNLPPIIIQNQVPAARGRGRPPAAAAQADDGMPAAPASAALRRAVGSTEEIKIRKVDDLGREGFIAAYPITVLAKTRNDPELYIQQYLFPHYGPGEYVVEGYNAKGQLVSAPRRITLMGAPNGHGQPLGMPMGMPPMPGMPQATSPARSVVDMLYERTVTLENELRAKANQPPKSAAEMAIEYDQLKKSFGGGSDALMFMLMQQQHRAAGDPALTSELAVLRAEVDRLRNAPIAAPAALPPLPMPAPSNDQPLANALVEVVKMGRPVAPPPGPDMMAMMATMGTMMQGFMAPMIEIIKMRGTDDSEKSYLRELVAELKEEVREVQSTPPRGITDIANELSAIKTVAEALGMKKGEEAEAEGNFFGFLREFVKSFPSNIAALGDLTSKVRANEAAARPQQPAPQQLAAAPVPEAPPAPPEAFVNEIKKLNAAEENATRLEVVIQSLWHLGQHPFWEARINNMIELTQQRKKPAALAEIRDFLTECAKAGMITDSAAHEATRAVDVNFELVAQYVDKATGKAPPEQPKPAKAAKLRVVKPAAQSEPDDDDEDEDDESGDDEEDADEPEPAEAAAPAAAAKEPEPTPVP